MAVSKLLVTGSDMPLCTRESFLLSGGLFLLGQLVEGSRGATRLVGRELLILQLLLNSVELIPRGRH